MYIMDVLCIIIVGSTFSFDEMFGIVSLFLHVM